MNTRNVLMSTAVLAAVGCAGSYPPPTQALADVQSANRSAVELGAQTNPNAQLHLKLAQEQLGQAQAAVAKEDNERAEGLLMRAKADAELAIALTRETTASSQAAKSVDQSNAQRSTNLEQGALQ